jgi:alkyldihydroxyacetonephosphate synthase
MNDTRKRSFWGWGWEDKFPDAAARKATGEHAQLMVGFAPERCDEPPSLESIELRAPLVSTPLVLGGFVTDEHEARVRHTYGKSYRDILRGFRGDFAPAPDLVATPRTEADITAVLDWASDAKVAVVPFGGGTSVVGGVEGDVDDRYHAVLSLDLGRLDRVVEVERSSLSARIQAGATGPGLEAQLAEQGLTLRHFPQSFEFSTLGGWVATRAGGHFATVYTHIDDLVQSTRAMLPGSGAGPSPDRLMVGSEGIFGVITEAWMRVRPRPVFRATVTAHFGDYGAAVEAVRALSQSGLYFESADHPVRAWMERALELVADHGGTCPKGPVYREEGERSGGSDGAGVWRDAFIDAPYLLNVMASMGVIVDTFETACTWDNFERLHSGVIRDVRQAMKDACGTGFISCRFTHVYPDGPAPYFTFIAPGRYGAELEQWMAIKKAASDAVIAHGGTITHHHAVGRLHRPWYEKQRPALFGDALRAVKGALDPGGVMNPGVLIEPTP